MEPDDVRTHIELLQGIILRMARNSAICKTWCVTLVAAIMVLVARTDTPMYTLIALVPTGLFLFLDTYYLALERAFRKAHETFVCKLHSATLELSDLYVFCQEDLNTREKLAVLLSPSIYPFYGALLFAIVLMYIVATLCA